MAAALLRPTSAMNDKPDLIAELNTLAEEPSAEKRRACLEQTADLFNAPGPNPVHRLQALGEALVLTLPKLNEKDRIHLAEGLALARYAPTYLIRQLAQDTPKVALSVLSKSPLITETDLSELAETCSDDHLAAIATRKDLTPELQEIIAKRGQDKALAALATNAHAALSENLIRQLMEDARTDPKTAKQLAAQPGLSARQRAELFFGLKTTERLTMLEVWGRDGSPPPLSSHANRRAQIDLIENVRQGGRAALTDTLIEGWHIPQKIAEQIAEDPRCSAFAVFTLGMSLERLTFSTIALLMLAETDEGASRGAAVLSLLDKFSGIGARKLVYEWLRPDVETNPPPPRTENLTDLD